MVLKLYPVLPLSLAVNLDGIVTTPCFWCHYLQSKSQIISNQTFSANRRSISQNQTKRSNSPNARFSNRLKAKQLKSQIIFHRHVSLANPLKISSKLCLIRRKTQPKLLKMRHHFLPPFSRLFSQGT